jgi:hypothetical protein
MNRKPPKVREHAFSRYMILTVGVIEKLQQDYFAGRDLGRSVPDIDADTAAIIVAESLEADRIWNLSLKRLLSGEFGKGKMSDFKRAALAEILFGVFDVAREMDNEEHARDWWALAMATLEEVLRSPTASPMLLYEDIFWDVAQASRTGLDREAIYWLKCGLAHNLYHNDGDWVVPLLRDLAEVYLSVGDLDTGLRMFTTLLHQDPADIWTYNVMAISFDRFGLTEVGSKATRRGLELLDAYGDPENLRDQLNDCLERMQTSESHEREAEVTPTVLAEVRAALALDFDDRKPYTPKALCRELVPDLDKMPVKRPMTPADFPLSDTPHRPQSGSPPERKLGRNDPCWCGSGKKYKHCHRRSDRRHGR